MPFFLYNEKGDNMELDFAIKNRRSVRKYRETEIEELAINQMIEAGLLAPSAHNRQPWEVVILRNQQQNISSIMKEYSKKHPEDVSISKTAMTIARCKVLLLVFCNNFDQLEYNILSIGAMIENMLLKATDLKIGSVWIANVVPIQKEICKHLQIDLQNRKLISAIALGYPLEESKPIARKSLEETIIYKDF